MKIQSLFLTLGLLISLPAFANDGKPSQSPEAQAIDKGCAAEAQATGCAGKEVGSGLLRCMHAYKKEHKKEFHFSDSCKEAMKAGRAHRRQMKASKQTTNSGEHHE